MRYVVRTVIALGALGGSVLLAWLDRKHAIPAIVVGLATAAVSGLSSFGKKSLREAWAGFTHDRASTRELTAGPGRAGRWIRVRDVDPLRLGIHQPADTGDGSDATLQAYVRRDQHDRLVTLIRSGGFVLLQGDSAAGKSRLAFEAALEAVPGWHIVKPASAENLAELAKLHLRRTVIWLENLELFLTAGGLTERMLDQLAPSGGSVTVIATMRLAAREALGKDGDGKVNDNLAKAAKDVIGLGERPNLSRIQRKLSPAESRRAAAISLQDARIADAHDHGSEDGFAPRLAGGPAALKHWEDGRESQHKVGAALISAAIDFRRAGYAEPIPKSTLVALHRDYLDQKNRNRVDNPGIEAELIWASRSELGTEGCLTLLEGDQVAVFDYLVDHVQRSALEDYPPVTEAVWDTALALATPDQAVSVGNAAYTHGRVDRAEAAYRAGAEARNAECLYGLAYVLSADPDRVAEAEDYYRQAVAAGSTDAILDLGNLVWDQPGRETEAEDLYHQAFAAGDTKALLNLGLLLSTQPGRQAEAEDHYRQAIAEADIKALRSLADLLSNQPGREAEAEDHYRQAITAGDTGALRNLGNLLSNQPGRAAEAEDFYRQAVAAGDTGALRNLGNLLVEQPGRENEAEESYRGAVAAGDTVAARNLAILLTGQPGRAAEAEDFYRQAVAAGDTAALLNLGNLLAGQPGREAEAEVTYRQALDAGDTGALLNLGLLLARQLGRGFEAEDFYRQAVAAGDTGALLNLGNLLAGQPGREAEAEVTYRQALDAGDTGALLNLGLLLSNQPGRRAEADHYYRQARAVEG